MSLKKSSSGIIRAKTLTLASDLSDSREKKFRSDVLNCLKQSNQLNQSDNYDEEISMRFSDSPKSVMQFMTALVPYRWSKQCPPEQEFTGKAVIIDYHSLVRHPVSHKKDGKFENITELELETQKMALAIKMKGEPLQINLIVKSFSFNGVSYNDMPRVILWNFCKAVPEWINKVFLTLVNGINDKDRERDDRTCVLLYDEFLRAAITPVILSYDKFDSMSSQLSRQVTLDHKKMSEFNATWTDSKIIKHETCVCKRSEKENINFKIENYTIVTP